MVRSVLLVAALAIGLGGCNTAYNYFEDEPDPALEGRDSTVFGSLLTASGIAAQPKSAIEYNPRAPLAIPGSTELPSPTDASAAQAAVDFPVDHDETERQRRMAAYERGQEAAYETEYTRGTTGRVSPDEVVAGRRAGGGLARLPEKVIPDNEKQTNFHLSREEMRQKIPTGEQIGIVLDEGGTAAPRRYLIQPPEAYRTPVASAPLPEEGDIENSEWIKKRLYDKSLERRPERAIPQQ
jgi:hypothetical protein